MRTIDLNCDMGESYGAWKMGADAEVMPFISSANIACGFHGGDPATIRKTVRLALEHGVAIGAHPSLPDLQGFGRRAMKISPQDMYDLVVYQAGALAASVARSPPIRCASTATSRARRYLRRSCAGPSPSGASRSLLHSRTVAATAARKRRAISRARARCAARLSSSISAIVGKRNVVMSEHHRAFRRARQTMITHACHEKSSKRLT